MHQFIAFLLSRQNSKKCCNTFVRFIICLDILHNITYEDDLNCRIN